MTYKKKFNALEKALYIDVRSESEYEQGHIEGAVNMPILNDEERHIVGDCYKNNSIEEAKRLGLGFASNKVVGFFDLVRQLMNETPDATIYFYCARGGFRSRSITQLLRAIGTEVFCLEGGYKNYRTNVLTFLDNPLNFPEFIMLHGFTGVGKTELLVGLNKINKPVLDLEKAANHKGSHLGSIGTDCIQSQQQFENRIFDCLIKLNENYCYVESESKRIGNVFIPPKLFEKLRIGKHIMVERDIDIRVNSLVQEYSTSDNFNSLVFPALEKIKRYISNELYQSLITLLNDQNYADFARLLLIHHYDPIYQKSINNYFYDLTCNTNDVDMAVNTIISWQKR